MKGGLRIQHKYIVVKSTYKNGAAKRTAFGIAAVEEYDGITTVLESISDISSDAKAVKRLVRLCNEHQLSLIHLREVVSDFLAII